MMRIPGRPTRRRPAARVRAHETEPTPMDPIALTLAIWLGLIACVTGVVRMSENASAQAALARRGEAVVQQIDLSKNFAFGS